jgi:hypothetical protein
MRKYYPGEFPCPATARGLIKVDLDNKKIREIASETGR